VTALTGGTFPAPRSVRPGGRTIVSVRGDLGFAAASALRERLIDALHRGPDLLVLDLSDVSTCDATGLAVLIATQRRARLLGITMRLAAPSLPVSKVLGATGLMGNFTICSDMSDALAPVWHEPARLA
jgi:anti-sigma B factor antagonist